MKFLYLLFLCFFSNALFAQQFGLIQDKDGYVNVRQKPSASEIIDTLKTGALVFAFEPEGEWCFVSYREGNRERESFGYVHQSRISSLSNFENIPVIKRTTKEVVLSKGAIQVRIEIQKFDSLMHLLTYSKEHFVTQIDGKDFWGTDGGVPKQMYRSIDLQVGDKNIRLQKSIQDLYEPNLEGAECFYDKATDTLYLTAGNSDGAGSYVVVWIIEKGKYKERMVVRPF